jgi:hypothetical protein
MNRLLAARLAGLSLVLVVGCEAKKTASMYPVSGKVTVDGKPLTSGMVTLIPDIGTAPHKGKSRIDTPGLSAGKIESDGHYEIFTNGESGAPRGKYRITVVPDTMPVPEGQDPPKDFNNKFSDGAKTELKFEVVEHPAKDAYDLKLTK